MRASVALDEPVSRHPALRPRRAAHRARSVFQADASQQTTREIVAPFQPCPAASRACLGVFQHGNAINKRPGGIRGDS